MKKLNYILTQADCTEQIDREAGTFCPPVQCSVCGQYAEADQVGQAWFKMTVDFDFGDAGSGPDPDIGTALICPRCSLPIRKGEMTWHEAVAKQA